MLFSVAASFIENATSLLVHHISLAVSSCYQVLSLFKMSHDSMQKSAVMAEEEFDEPSSVMNPLKTHTVPLRENALMLMQTNHLSQLISICIKLSMLG